MEKRTEEYLTFLKETLGRKTFEIMYAHEHVNCNTQEEQVIVRLSDQSRTIFMLEIQKVRDGLEFLIEYKLFGACIEVVKVLDDKLKEICVDSTGKDCCVELNSTRQWMGALLLCFGFFE